MLPDWVSNPGPLTYESGALPIALRGPATSDLLSNISLVVGRSSLNKYTAQKKLSHTCVCPVDKIHVQKYSGLFYRIFYEI